MLVVALPSTWKDFVTAKHITHEPKVAPRDAPPLLFVHGAYVGGWCWAENFLPYFAALGYRACAVNLRGSNNVRRGGSRALHASLCDYLEILESSIASLGEPPVLIGHSMGGYLVQEYLSRQSAPAAVLMASVPPQGLLPATAWLAFTNPLLLHQMHVMQWFGPRAVFTLYGVDGGRLPLFSPHLPDDKVLRYASRARVESPWAILAMALPVRARHSDAGSDKALVMGAALDSLIPASAVHATANAFGTDAVFVPDIGHAMMLDHHWEDAANAIRDWLFEQGM